MGTISELQRKNSDRRKGYKARVRIKGYPYISRVFDRRTDAREWIRRTEAEIRAGRFRSTSRRVRKTLGEVIDQYIVEVMPEKAGSCRQLNQLMWWKAELGKHYLDSITPAEIREKKTSLKRQIVRGGRERSNASVNRYLAALSHVYSESIKVWGYVDSNPLRSIRRMKEPPGRCPILNSEDRGSLLAACKDSPLPSLYPIVVLAISTGMRKGEILNLRIEDVDLRVGWVRLARSKNGEGRGIPLGQKAIGALKDYLRETGIQSTLLFPNPKNSDEPIAIDRAWRTARDQAGLTKVGIVTGKDRKGCQLAEMSSFRFHDLRHSAASYLAMNGCSVTEIAAILGHKTLQMVQRYTHVYDSHLSTKIDDLDHALFKESRF